MLIHSCEELQKLTAELRREGKRIGLVPTMGALHEGHLSLVQRSVAETDQTIVSIFVNPTQFGPTEDFDKYPRTLESDLERLASLELPSGQNPIIAFAPAADEMYPQGFSSYVTVGGAAEPLEGAWRPTHFRGVATVVLKLFNLAMADTAYFGQKDFQQVQVVRQFVRELNVPIRITMCPILREADGLAMSSRNRYLSPEARQWATILSASLKHAEKRIHDGCRSASTLETEVREMLGRCPLLEKIDYIAIVHAETLQPQTETLVAPLAILLAVRLAGVRLIDNLVIERF